MGNNAAFTAFEASVIALYDAGGLTPDLLDALGGPYRGTDIDHGGSHELLTQDGLFISEVIVKTLCPADYGILAPLRAKLGNAIYPMYEGVLQEDIEDYVEALQEIEFAIEKYRWGWV